MYTYHSTVRYSECGSDALLTIPAMINYLQDCSTFHTESIGHGFDYCAERGIAWFIAAWQIRIFRLPRFTERIRVSTWCHNMKVTLASRNFLMETEDGNPLVWADSLWFTFDIVHGRPVRIPSYEMVYLTDDEPLDLPPTQRKLTLAGKSEQLPSITVEERHLDMNRHVNNGQYVAMANDLIGARTNGFRPDRILVSYKRAAQLGDMIVPRFCTEKRGYAVDLTDTDGTSFAVVRMERAAT